MDTHGARPAPEFPIIYFLHSSLIMADPFGLLDSSSDDDDSTPNGHKCHTIPASQSAQKSVGGKQRYSSAVNLMGKDSLQHAIHLTALSPDRLQNLAEIYKWDMSSAAGRDLAKFILAREVICEVVPADTQGLNIVKLPQVLVRVDCKDLEKKMFKFGLKSIQQMYKTMSNRYVHTITFHTKCK